MALPVELFFCDSVFDCVCFLFLLKSTFSVLHGVLTVENWPGTTESDIARTTSQKQVDMTSVGHPHF